MLIFVCMFGGRKGSFSSLKEGVDPSLHFIDQEIFYIFQITGISREGLTPLIPMN